MFEGHVYTLKVYRWNFFFEPLNIAYVKINISLKNFTNQFKLKIKKNGHAACVCNISNFVMIWLRLIFSWTVFHSRIMAKT